MPLKAKFLECECGALFQEGEDNSLKGEFFFTPWKITETKKVDQKHGSDPDMLLVNFCRDVCCQNCRKELIVQHKKYEVTPPENDQENTIVASSSFKYYF